MNQRDYQHSTPFNKEELEALTSHNKDQQDSFIRDRVRELANCLIWLIEHEDIPPISSDRKTGGLAVIGWSSGNCLMFPFLALSDEVISDKNQKDVLSKNIRAVVIYGEFAGQCLPTRPMLISTAIFRSGRTGLGPPFTSFSRGPRTHIHVWAVGGRLL